MRLPCLLAVALLLSGCSATPTPPDRQPPVIAPGTDTALPRPPPAEPFVPGKPAPGGSLAERPAVQTFIQEMASRHRFDRDRLYGVFSRARSQPEIITLMNRPAEAKPWYAYREIFLTPKRIQGGVEFWRAYAVALARAESTYGVPAEIVVAIIGVETSYGGNAGKYRVLEALATLAFDYPRRASYFRKQLEDFLLLTREEGMDPLTVKGSYAGAMGYGQFMPGSYRSYAVDFDGDGRRDLWNNPVDAIGSVANYLSRHRWQRGKPVTSPAQVDGSQYQALLSDKLQPPTRTVGSFRQLGVMPRDAVVEDDEKAVLLEFKGSDSPEYWLGFDNFYVITRYNHSQLYAMAVYQLGQAVRSRRV
jgi:membrane-bound lytic murein transglycosylase B